MPSHLRIWLVRCSLAALVLSGATACVNLFYTPVHVDAVPADRAPVTVQSPVKAHLVDGTTVVYRSGVTVSADTVHGPGERFGLTLEPLGSVSAVALDSIVGMESFSGGELDQGKSVAVSFGATAAAALLTPILLVALFGSCPTVYSAAADSAVLEAEAFSYSVAPLLEGRDVDRLGVQADPEGQVRLEIRNEALETHFINHLELLEVVHGTREGVGPDPQGRPLAWGSEEPAGSAVDRAGRDVTAVLASADGVAFATAEARLDSATATDWWDHVDLTFPAPEGQDSAALVLRLRNSLLNTVLFYDLMLGQAGARALDWMAVDLQRIGPAVALGRWYTSRMGLWVAVWEDGTWRGVTRVPDSGPIAWKDVAVVVPVVPGADSLRLRLSFVADAWRIDRAALAGDVRRPPFRSLPVAGVVSGGSAVPEALEALALPDESYLETRGGQAFEVRFDAGPEPPSGGRTFLLSSQGYYTEWVRPAWIRSAGAGRLFEPSDAALGELLERWRQVKGEMEVAFFSTRIPVR